MNANGVIFNNVYDNGYSNNQVIFSFRDNLKNGGFNRLEKYGDIPRYSPSQRVTILNSTPKIETSATLGEQPGIGLYRDLSIRMY